MFDSFLGDCQLDLIISAESIKDCPVNETIHQPHEGHTRVLDVSEFLGLNEGLEKLFIPIDWR